MTVGAAMQSAALRISGTRPASFYGNSQQLAVELCDLVNEVAQDVASYQDWQALTKVATLPVDGVTTEFDLPSDYEAMLLASNITDLSNWFWNYFHVTDVNQFLELQASGFDPWPGIWILYGNKLRFSPAPTENATYPYASKNFAYEPSTGVEKDAFTADSDEFLLPERLLTLGLVWRWREQKKLDFTGDQEAFTKAIGEYGAKDKGGRAIRRNARRFYPGVGVAWPWPLG